MATEIIKSELVTIGITTFNASETIRQAVDSALGQIWKPVEIIIVDDASTDNTLEIISAMAQKYDNISIYFNSENSGVATSRNRILEMGTGEFVVFFDDDDISLPDRIEKQYKRIIDYEQKYSHGQPVICHTARLQRYPNGMERHVHTMGEQKNCLAPNGIAVAARILLGTPLKNGYGACPTCSQMARMAVYKAVDGFDEELRRSEDTDLNIRLAYSGGHFVGISSPLVIQTMTKTTEKNIEDEFNNTQILFFKHRDFMQRHGQYEFCKQWLEIKYSFLKKNNTKFFLSILSLFIRYPLCTLKRILMAIQNISYNRAISRFYLNVK